MNGYLVQLYKPLALRHALLNENRIEVFHIRQADKFIDCSVVTYVPFEIGIGFAPLLCRYTKHRYIQHIGFVGVNYTRLCWSNLRWDKVLLYRVGVVTIQRTR